jgi:5-methylcytosine-specific restriction endonuclease McrA
VEARQRQNAYLDSRREERRAWMRAYRKRHPSSVAVGNANATARRYGITDRLTIPAVEARIAYFGGRCYRCGVPTHGIDHVIPMGRGGRNVPANVRPCCPPCNSAKNVKDWRSVA